MTVSFVALTPSTSYAKNEKTNYSMYLNISEGLVQKDVNALDQLSQQIHAIIEPVLKKRNKNIRLTYANEELNLPTVAASAVPVKNVELAEWLKSEEVQEYLEEEKVDYLLLGRFDYSRRAHKLRFLVVDTKKIDQIVSANKKLFESMGTINLEKYLDKKEQLGEVRHIVKNIVHYLNNNIASLKQHRVVQCECFLFDRHSNLSPGMASIGTSFTSTFAQTLKDKYEQDESITIIKPKIQNTRKKECDKMISFDAIYADLVITRAITLKSGNTNILVDMDIRNPRNDFESVDFYSKEERRDETGRLANNLVKRVRKVMDEFF